jgi:solute carrier family 35 protein F1/2
LKNHWKILLFGQALSLLLASAGAAQATLHLDCGLSAPTFTMTMIYFGLSSIFSILLWRRRRIRQSFVRCGSDDGLFQDPSDGSLVLSDDDGIDECSTAQEELEMTNMRTSNNDEVAVVSSSSNILFLRRKNFFGILPLHQPLWWYMLLAFLDVEANAITMLAFRYTTLTSVTLLDSLAIPSSMILSRCWLGRRYRWMHYLGVIICMLGVVANIMTDYESDISTNGESEEEKRVYPNKLRGDLCAITGGIAYGIGDVLSEVTVSQIGDNTEYLAVMGFFAFIISLVQSLYFEWEAILAFFGKDDTHSSECSIQKGWLLFFIFVGVTMLSYAGGSRFLMISEATFFNLSLLTGDLWSVTFSVFAERIVPRPLFFVALVFVLSGVVLYEMAPSPASEKEQYGPVGNNHLDDVNDGIINHPDSRLIDPKE